MSNRGIIFYNCGTGAAVRTVVAIHSLRKLYQGAISILSDGEASDDLCKKIASEKRLNVDVVNADFNVRGGRNHHYLSKCRLHEHTPYDVSLYLDADIIVRGDVSSLFERAEANEFVVPQFSTWTTSGRMISRRIMAWSKIVPNDMFGALKFGPAINTGVMAFIKDSQFMKAWYRVAKKGKEIAIPDETSCQVLVHKYPHEIAEWYFNASCRFDNCLDPQVRIIHYHGRKHCRENLPFHGNLWMEEYEEVLGLNLADIQSWTPSGDRQLKWHISRKKGA